MSDHHEFSVDAARQAAAREELDEWVTAFLASPGSDNDALADMLSERLAWWTGPLRLPISRLHRLAGPPGDPVLCPVDDDYWRDDVEDLGEKVEDGFEPPPVIVAFRHDQLVLEDGNHRVEALRRAGKDMAWALVGFESEDERNRFHVPPDDRADAQDRRPRAPGTRSDVNG
jgi:hypothetical protein